MKDQELDRLTYRVVISLENIHLDLQELIKVLKEALIAEIEKG